MREKRKEKDVFLRRMGIVLPLIEYVVKADIFLDMLALIFTGFNDSAENVLLRCLLAPRIVIFGPLFYLAMFYGGQASDASFRAMGQERAKTACIRVAVCLLLLIFAAVRAHKRAVALKKNAAEENGRTGQTPKSA